jgi:rhamnosyltransferase
MADIERSCGIVVTYFPGDELEHNLRAVAAECAHVIVVDNGSGAKTHERIAAVGGIELVGLEHNRGIAAALNIGARLALERGFQWAITFDQDSCPSPGFAAELHATQAKYPSAAVIGPRIDEAGLQRRHLWLRPHPGFRSWFQRVPCVGSDLVDVTMVVSSGALTDLNGWAKLGGFDEALFIDYVDTDYCLRARRIGRTIAVSAGALLRHHLGRRESRQFAGLTFHPTNHGAVRHYYIARNRIRMLRRHARELHWLAFEAAATSLWVFRVLALESQKGAKFKAMFLGTWDGLRGRSGECPPWRLKALG